MNQQNPYQHERQQVGRSRNQSSQRHPQQHHPQQQQYQRQNYAYSTRIESETSRGVNENNYSFGLPVVTTQIVHPIQTSSNQQNNVYVAGSTVSSEFNGTAQSNNQNIATDFQVNYGYGFQEDYDRETSDYYDGNDEYNQEQVQFNASTGNHWNNNERHQYDQQHFHNPNIFVEHVGDGYDYSATTTLSPISPEPLLSTTYSQPTNAEAGSYYPIPSIDERVLSGTPVTAIAYDEHVAALYVATVTTSHTSNNNASFNNIQSRSRGRGLQDHNYRHGRASLMATYDIGLGNIYSIVQSHPEAEPKTLQTIYESVYGCYVSKDRHHPPNGARSLPRIPNHAYKPCFGDVDPVCSATNAISSPDGSDVFGYSGDCQMGVQTILPVTGQGNVISLSPSAVRLHTTGGLQVFDCEIEGMICGTPHPVNGSSNQSMTHITIGGIATSSIHNSSTRTTIVPSQRNTKYHVQCLDIWQGFRNVSSCVLGQTTNKKDSNEELAATALATCYSRSCIMAGCSDGTLRLLDGRGLREHGKYKSHNGGVVNMAVSEDGTLVATTGYGSLVTANRGGTDSGNCLYAFPDTSVLIYDIRYMGRGGISHSFSGLRGGPRFVAFIPNTVEETTVSNRLLVASGQTGGGMQIIAPFQEESTFSKSSYIVPQLKRGEAISSLCISEDCLALGTSQGNVLQYKLAGYESNLTSLSTNMSMNQSGVFMPSIARRAQSGGSSISTLSRGTTGSSRISIEKIPLKVPSFHPPLPALSLDAALLLAPDPNIRNGTNDKMKNIISSYILVAEPTVTPISDLRQRLATEPIVPQIRLQVSADLVKEATQAAGFLQTIPASSLNLDLFDDHRTEHHVTPRNKLTSLLHQNPNKMIYTNKLFDLLYRENLNRVKRYGKGLGKHTSSLSIDSIDDGAKLVEIPSRYRVKLRPSHLSASSFNHWECNKTGLLPGKLRRARILHICLN